MIVVTFETIQNDDLHALTRLPFAFGASSSRLESNLVYDVLQASQIMGDTKELFHTDHGNLAATPSVIDEAALDKAEQAFMAQKTISGEDYVSSIPRFLVCGPKRKVQAKKILSNIQAAKTGDVNVYQNAMELVVESRITDYRWHLAGDPAVTDTIELAHLEGMEGPVIESMYDFKSDGQLLKCMHIAGAKALDWRGLFKNAGHATQAG
jgi:hypothetical protein